MKKITWWLLSTATVLILLFSYHTSTNSVAATDPPSISTPATKAATRVPTSTATTTITATVTAEGGSAPTTAAAGTGRSTAAAAAPSTTAPATTSAAQAAAASGTFTGDAADTRYGPVQVQITVQDGTITAATALQYPYNDHRDQEINDYAIPVLNQETVDGQSANISMVSGATYTSEGYLQSLQSAIDQAHL